MLARLVLAGSLLATGTARADDEVYDPTTDECADPAAGCAAETPDLDDAALESTELSAPAIEDPVDWTVAADTVACPDGSMRTEDGRCTPDAGIAPVAAVDGGCAAAGTTGGIALVVAFAGLVVLARRRRALLVMAIAAACTAEGGGDWDSAIDDGLAPDRSDVFAAAIGDGDQAVFVLANQALAAGAQTPTAQFALDRSRGAMPILRAPSACGDRLVNQDGAELLGWARAEAGDGTAELVELVAPDGCAHVYETHPESIETLVADGYTVAGSLGSVWPPGGGDVDVDTLPEAADDEPFAALAPACRATKTSPIVLLYASPGADETLRFLTGCPGEVIVGEKGENGPRGSMRTAAAHALGGRSAFVTDNHGIKLRDLLLRSNGVERTAAYFKHKLALGYDYIVIDEITTASDWRDGSTANRRLREVLLRLPPRTVIPYISIDLVQYPSGFASMRSMRYLLRAFKRHGRALAMEVYLHTASVMAGSAPAAFRKAADRLALAVKGMKYGGGINLRAVTTIGTSMHCPYSQYRYLDQPAHDLASITRQVNALRHGSARVRQQKGVAYYFVNKSDMAPPSAYSYDALIKRMRTQALRFR
jgi:uncharacterized protein (TIGR03382 family)